MEREIDTPFDEKQETRKMCIRDRYKYARKRRVQTAFGKGPYQERNNVDFIGGNIMEIQFVLNDKQVKAEVGADTILLNEKPKGIINIVDATNMERNLYLTCLLYTSFGLFSVTHASIPEVSKILMEARLESIRWQIGSVISTK